MPRLRLWRVRRVAWYMAKPLIGELLLEALQGRRYVPAYYDRQQIRAQVRANLEALPGFVALYERCVDGGRPDWYDRAMRGVMFNVSTYHDPKTNKRLMLTYPDPNTN